MNARTYYDTLNYFGWRESNTTRYYTNRATQWQKQIKEAVASGDLTDVEAMRQAKREEIERALHIAELEHRLGFTLDDPLAVDKAYMKSKEVS